MADKDLAPTPTKDITLTDKELPPVVLPAPGADVPGFAETSAVTPDGLVVYVEYTPVGAALPERATLTEKDFEPGDLDVGRAWREIVAKRSGQRLGY